jgi:DNA-binding transcriptional regulator YiaG
LPSQAEAIVDSQAIAKWAEKQAKPAHTPKYDRLTRTDISLLLKYKREGLSQTEIAQRLGCTQGTVSKWLNNLTDTKEPAKEYLAGAALRMAQNIVNKGLARDHIQALNGLGVLNQQDTGKLSIVINGLHLHGTGSTEPLSPPGTVVDSEVIHSLSGDVGSDNS